MVLQPALADEHRGCDQNNDRYAEHNDARRVDHVVPHNIRSALDTLRMLARCTQRACAVCAIALRLAALSLTPSILARQLV